MKNFTCSPCELHTTINPNDCIDCNRYLKWVSPAIIAWMSKKRKTWGSRPYPCITHIKPDARCIACENWRIVEQKSYQFWKRKELRLSKRTAIRDKRKSERLITESLAKNHSFIVSSSRGNMKRSSISDGYIYVISNPIFSGWVKIGSAIIMNERLAAYQTADPFRSYQIDSAFLVRDRAGAEIDIIKRLADAPSNGEWFQVSRARAIMLVKRTAKKFSADSRLTLQSFSHAKA